MLAQLGICRAAAAELLGAAAHVATASDSGNVIARLGNHRVLLEEQGDAAGIAALEAKLASGRRPARIRCCAKTARFVLGGARAREVLAQVCNVNFAALDIAAQPVVMTLMIGVAVLVVPQLLGSAVTVYRIWCDPSFGPYLRGSSQTSSQELPRGANER